MDCNLSFSLVNRVRNNNIMKNAYANIFQRDYRHVRYFRLSHMCVDDSSPKGDCANIELLHYNFLNVLN